MHKDINRLRIIRDKILENKLNPEMPVGWENNKTERLEEELLHLNKLKYADEKTLQLLKFLKKTVIKTDINIINKEIEEIAFHIDLEIDKLYHKKQPVKKTLKKIILGALIGSSALIPGHKIPEEVKPEPKQQKIEQKEEPRRYVPEPKMEMRYVQKEHFSKKQLKEIKEIADITYAEICEYASPKKYNPHVIIAVSSTILNRVEQRPKEFGNTIHKVIHKKNAYYGLKNKMYKQANKLKFSSDENKQAYVNTYKLVKKVYLGQTKRYPGYFYFTPKEIEKLKKSKHFDFAQLKLDFTIGPYYVYSYKV